MKGEYLKEYNGIKSGDSIRRVNKDGSEHKFKTEGIVKAIQKFEPDKKCIADKVGAEYCICEQHYWPESRRIWFEVAVNGDLTHIQLINARQVKKIDKHIPINRGGQLVLA